MWSGQRLNIVDEKLFKIDNKFDVILTPENVVILNKLNFERLFLDLDIVAEALHAIAAEVTVGLNMAADSLNIMSELARENVKYRRMLRSIKARGVLAAATLDNMKLEIQRQGYPEADFILDGRFVVNDQNAERAFRLLNEDRYLGGISGFWYDVDRKSVEPQA